MASPFPRPCRQCSSGHRNPSSSMISCPSRSSLLCTGWKPSLLAASVSGNQPSGSMLMFMVLSTVDLMVLQCVHLTATFHSRCPDGRFMP